MTSEVFYLLAFNGYGICWLNFTILLPSLANEYVNPSQVVYGVGVAVGVKVGVTVAVLLVTVPVGVTVALPMTI